MSFKRVSSLIAVVAVALAIWISQRASPESPRAPYTTGRNNTVLFITDKANGLSNVHVATSFALLEKHPEVEVHYASFPGLAKDVSRVSQAALAKNPVARPITWHEVSGPSFSDACYPYWPSVSESIVPPGTKGINKLMTMLEIILSPWEADDHWALYTQLQAIVQEVDPAVIVLDTLFRPAMDVVRNMNRAHAIVCPNALTDAFVSKQPWGAMFWKYPTLGSGHPYPVPWRLIPTNIYLQLRFLIAVFITPNLDVKRAYLAERGVNNPIDFLEVHRDDVPWLSMAFPEAGLPLDVLPPNVTSCGPIVLDIATAEEQDAELAAWLKRAPTMLINLGSSVRYSEQRAIAIAEALIPVFETTKTQVLWKFRKDDGDDYSEEWRKPVDKYIASGRLRLEKWLAADPSSLLNTGDIVVSVHHGGANCYFETVLSGIPQVILPLWVDLYNFAQIAEYLGIGVWPGQDIAPEWESESISQGFLKALTSVSMREKAKTLGDVAKTYGGRDTAARELAHLAAAGH